MRALLIRDTILTMKTRIHHAAGADQVLAAYGLDPRRVIYFDIETTGFRASSSSLYMIGWAVRADSVCPEQRESDTDRCFSEKENSSGDSGGRTDWTVTQILATSRSEEILMLKQFADILRGYDTVIEFNGDRFDLPYLREKYEAYALEDPFAHLSTVDLYQKIRPFRQLLGLTRLNQKSVEQFLQIRRTDPYNGGELIDVYRSVKDHRCDDDAGALDALFLHNYEDVLGMLRMTPLLSYPMMINSAAPVSVRVLNPECSGRTGSDNGSLSSRDPVALQASFSLEAELPKEVFRSFEKCCSVAGCGRTVTVTIHALSGSLFHFFPDYRNYYYLPEEDTAIHKSVASFVDPSHREKASARTCYVKKDGVFLPLAGETALPVFRRFYKDPVRWFEFCQEMLEDRERVSCYIHALVRELSFRN